MSRNTIAASQTDTLSLIAQMTGTEPLGPLAIVDGQRDITWDALRELVSRGVNRLLSAPRPPDRVAVFAQNATETAVAYLTALRSGISAVPVNFHFTAGEVAYILADAGAKMLFVGPETAKVGLAAARIAGLSEVVGWRCADIAGLTDWDEWLARASPAEPPLSMAPRPYLHYTSGTTGRPKGAETPPNMLPQSADVAKLFAELRTMVARGVPGATLLVGPMYHTGPLTSVRDLAGGKPLVIMRRFDAETMLALVERWRTSFSVMVPTHLQRLLSLPDDVRLRYDVSSILKVNHTGAACPADVKRAMIAWWGPVLDEGYGATESGTTNVISSAEWLARPGSVGKTQPPFEPVIIGEDGTEQGAGQEGLLYFRDTSGRGIIYHNDREKTASVHRAPGVFTLGDIGYFDAEGYIYITDRASDMIVSGGVNIYPAEIEQVLIEHPHVSDVAVIGTPEATMGEEVKALVIRATGCWPEAADLDLWCRARVAGYKCPRSYEFVDDIGRNAMGKVNKRALRQPYWPSDRTIGG